MIDFVLITLCLKCFTFNSAVSLGCDGYFLMRQKLTTKDSDSDVNTSAMCVHELLEQHQKLRGKYKVSELLHFYCYLFKSSKHLVDTNRGNA